MNLGEFARITANLKGITEYLYFHVLGEPLCHPLLAIFIEHAKRCGFKAAITTNGTLLKSRGEELLLAKPYKMNISLHSFEGESESARIAYIESCLDFADRASKAGILVVLRLWNLSESGVADASVENLNGDVMRLLSDRFGEFEQISERGARVRDKLHIEFGKRFEWPDGQVDDLGQKVFCHGLGDHFAILADGTVVPCCLDADGVMKLGNIFESDIREILNSDRAQNIKKGFSDKCAVEDLCRRCPYARRFKV
jgi:radical SAM protein with 4Fe4S-binding SPASM domain